jgi:hypothetical protein
MTLDESIQGMRLRVMKRAAAVGVPRDGLVARIAYLTSGWTTPQSADAIERQATVPELLTDEDTDSFVHGPTIAALGAPHPRGRSTRHASESVA